jgi:hypothetical protein
MGGDCIRRSFMVCTLRQVSGDQIKKNEMVGASGVYGGEVHTGYWCGNLRERDHLEDLGVDGRIILKLIFRIGWESMDCIYLAQERHSVVNTVMKFRVS